MDARSIRNLESEIFVVYQKKQRHVHTCQDNRMYQDRGMIAYQDVSNDYDFHARMKKLHLTKKRKSPRVEKYKYIFVQGPLALAVPSMFQAWLPAVLPDIYLGWPKPGDNGWTNDYMWTSFGPNKTLPIGNSF